MKTMYIDLLIGSVTMESALNTVLVTIVVMGQNDLNELRMWAGFCAEKTSA